MLASMSAPKSADLCWGQHHHLLHYLQVPAEFRHDAHIAITHPLPAGTGTAHVRSALNYLIRRHEVLRTVYDLHALPWPQQRVQPPGQLSLREASTEDDGTPAPAEMIRRLTETAFDITSEWPIRAGVVTTGGVPKRLHLVFNHLALDDVSLDLFTGELDTVLLARVERAAVNLPAVRYQPVDLARHESALSPDAVDSALAHWHGELRRAPADVYARRRDAGARPGAAHSASFTAPALLGTARTIAGRQRVWPSAVHLAAYAVTLAAYSGEGLVACRMYTSQREASGYRDVLTCASYPTLASFDLTDDPAFSTVLTRAAARVEESMTHAHIPYDRVLELMSLESSRRGQFLRVDAELNFLNYAPRSCRTKRDRFVWNAEPADWAQSGVDSYFRIYEWCDGITLALQAMTEVMDRDAVEAFLRGYARLVEAHRQPGPDLRLSEAAELMGFTPPRPRPMLRVGTDAVDLDRTVAALRTHEAVVSLRLAHTERGLVAEVVADRPITPAQLRTHLLGAMHEQPAVRCPDWFQITDAQQRFPLVQGEGSPSAPLPVRAGAEQVLTSVVAEVNGLCQVDPADSYCTAGGRALRLPRVLTALRAQGWDGVSIHELTSARPLRTLADRMRPTVAESGEGRNR